jgi:hypothetical protein
MNLTDRKALLQVGISDDLITEIIDAGVSGIMLVSTLRCTDERRERDFVPLAVFRPLSNVIQIKKDFDLATFSSYFSKKMKTKIFPEEVHCFLLLHEYGHFLNHKSEQAADKFALLQLEKIRKKKQLADLTEQITLALERGISAGIKEAFRSVI